MNSDLSRVGLAFALSLLLSLVSMPVAISLGKHLKATVAAKYFRNSRSTRRMSYLGGLAVAFAAIVGAFIARNPDPTGIIALFGGVVLLALAFPENRTGRKTHWAAKFLIQGAAAALVWWFMLRVQLPGPVGGAVTILTLVAVANAFNWLDNMNGVAGATGAATGAGITALALFNGNPAAALPTAAICGACLGFLPFNWKRPKVYLGAGAPEFIGFVLAASALNVATGAAGLVWGLLATLCLLIVPAIDFSSTLLSRLTTGRHPTKPGLDHLSHRLYRIGFGRRKIAFLHGLTALVGAGAVLASSLTGPNALVALPVLYGFIALAIVVADHRKLAVRSRRGRIIKYALLAVLALGLLAAPTVARAAWDMRGAQREFAQAIAATKNFQLAAAEQHFQRGGRLAEQAEARLEMWVTLPARYIPVAGDNLRAAEALAEGASLAAPAATTAVQAAQTLGGPQVLQGGFSDGQIPIDPLRQAAAGLQSAATQAELALSAVEASGGIILPPLSGARTEFITQIQEAIDTLHAAGDAATLMPYVFGADGSRTWLLIIQNPVEIRATGGFLGAFGILSASGGKLSLDRFDSNADLPPVAEPVDAPEEFADNYDRYSSRTFWRNTNMSPDFPTVAGVMAEMWRSGTGQQIDGVIAVDAVGLNYLLELVGPVNSQDMGEINSQNFLDLALNEAYIRFPEKEERSSVLLEVGREVWSRLLGGNFPEARRMIEPLGEMVTTKRLQMWSPPQQERIERLGLSGALRPGEESDFLMLVGQNAAGGKMDYYAERTLTYRVDLTDPNNPAGEITVQIENNAPDSGLPRYIIGPFSSEFVAGQNRTITSIYLPEFAGVTRTTVNGEPSGIETYTEQGLSVASKVLDTLSGQTTTMSLATRPLLADPGIYRLVLQQQPTLNPDHFELEVVLPAGALVHETSGGLRRQGNVLTWSGDLDRAREFEVRYGPWLQLPSDNP